VEETVHIYEHIGVGQTGLPANVPKNFVAVSLVHFHTVAEILFLEKGAFGNPNFARIG
jgi:hypothetical protein